MGSLAQTPAGTRLTADVLIVGGGVVGLWTARACVRAGLSVVLAERDRIGAGASGGVMGALMPYYPSGWEDRKAFQLEGLLTLPDELAALKDDTGLPTGYVRCGRVMPLADEAAHVLALKSVEGAAENWRVRDPAATFDIRAEPPVPGWPDPAAGPFGFAVDRLSARIDPLSLLRSLQASLDGKADLRIGAGLKALDPTSGLATLSDGTVISANAIALTAGHETYGLFGPFLGRIIGNGVGGRAVLVRMDKGPVGPIVHAPGTHVVPLGHGLYAIGSSSDRPGAALPDSHEPPEFFERAIGLVPALREAALVEDWYGYRPNSLKRQPLIGPVPSYPRLLVATGGYGISFAIAHLFGAILADTVAGREAMAFPKAFTFARHLRNL